MNQVIDMKRGTTVGRSGGYVDEYFAIKDNRTSSPDYAPEANQYMTCDELQQWAIKLSASIEKWTRLQASYSPGSNTYINITDILSILRSRLTPYQTYINMICAATGGSGPLVVLPPPPIDEGSGELPTEVPTTGNTFITYVKEHPLLILGVTAVAGIGIAYAVKKRKGRKKKTMSGVMQSPWGPVLLLAVAGAAYYIFFRKETKGILVPPPGGTGSGSGSGSTLETAAQRTYLIAKWSPDIGTLKATTAVAIMSATEIATMYNAQFNYFDKGYSVYDLPQPLQTQVIAIIQKYNLVS